MPRQYTDCLSAVVLPQPPVPRTDWRELWLITIGHGLTHWYPATFYLLLPLIGNELGLSYSQIGLIMTCNYIACGDRQRPGGVLVDTVGRKGLLMAVSLFWIGFPYLLIGFTHSYAMLLVCVALVGFGNSLWHPTAIPTLGRRYPERKGLVLSIHGMGGNVGDAIAPIVIGAALAVLHLARSGDAEPGSRDRSRAAAVRVPRHDALGAKSGEDSAVLGHLPAGLRDLAAQPRRWCCFRPAPPSAP